MWLLISIDTISDQLLFVIALEAGGWPFPPFFAWCFYCANVPRRCYVDLNIDWVRVLHLHRRHCRYQMPSDKGGYTISVLDDPASSFPARSIPAMVNARRTNFCQWDWLCVVYRGSGLVHQILMHYCIKNPSFYFFAFTHFLLQTCNLT